MNYLKSYIIVIMLFIGTLGCTDDLLDKTPQLSFSEENAFENFEITQTYALGLYQIFPGYNLGVINSDWNSDLMMNNSTTMDSDWLWERVTVPTSSSLWNFSFIRRVNIMLRGIENSTMTPIQINHWKSVGYFFRSYDYFDKLKAYGDIPWIDKVVSDTDEELLFGARAPRDQVAQNMLDDLLFAEANILKPGTNNIVSNSIDVHIVRALISRFGLFEGTWRKYHGLPDAEKYLRASAEASAKLIADHPNLYPNYNELFNSPSLKGVPGILLYKQYEPNVLTHILTSRHRNSAGNWDITKRGADKYLLTDGQTRWNSPLFETDKDPYAEFRNRDRRMLYTIVPPFRVIRVAGDNFSWLHTDNPDDREYIDLFNQISTETQKNLPSRNWAGFVLRVSPHYRDFNEGDPYNVSRTGYNLFKYYNRLHDIQNIDFSDAPIFRMGEVLVNHAEVKWELGEFNQSVADQTINKLRARGKVAPMHVNQITADFDPTRDPSVDPLLWEIRRERAVELMAEGYRFDDLRRWKKLHEYGAEEKLGRWLVRSTVNNRIRVQNDAAEGYISIFGPPPGVPMHYYLYPVPSDQIVLNPNIEQNPGW